MFNTHRGDEVLESSPGVAPEFFTSVTRNNATGTIYIKAVNASGAPRTVKIEIAGAGKIASESELIELSGDPEDFNSIREPKKVVPVEHTLHGIGPVFEHDFPPYSVTVLVLSLRSSASVRADGRPQRGIW
jgi:alpha-N-arabinofuranosidase